MSLDAQRLEDAFVARFEAIGGVTEGEHAWFRPIAKIFAEETVKEITTNAKADIQSGSSAGQHPIV